MCFVFPSGVPNAHKHTTRDTERKCELVYVAFSLHHMRFAATQLMIVVLLFRWYFATIQKLLRINEWCDRLIVSNQLKHSISSFRLHLLFLGKTLVKQLLFCAVVYDSLPDGRSRSCLGTKRTGREV